MSPDPNTDLAHALVAEAYEVAAKELEKWAEPGVELGHDLTDETFAIRALTPADAIAAREARDKQVREQALREAAAICNQSYGGSIGDVHKAILALLDADDPARPAPVTVEEAARIVCDDCLQKASPEAAKQRKQAIKAIMRLKIPSIPMAQRWAIVNVALRALAGQGGE